MTPTSASFARTERGAVKNLPSQARWCWKMLEGIYSFSCSSSLLRTQRGPEVVCANYKWENNGDPSGTQVVQKG